MASIYQRGNLFWVKLRDPRTGETVRHSLETGDPARAKLLKERIEIEAKLADPRFLSVEVPPPLAELLGTSPAGPVIAPAHNSQVPVPPRVAVEDALRVYIEFTRQENEAHHFADKVSKLRQFFGDKRIEPFEPKKLSKSRPRKKRAVPFKFRGRYVDEITPEVLGQYFSGLTCGDKTKRGYRQVFHQMFQVWIKQGIYHPPNFHCPNPVAALPSYQSKNSQIVFLRPEQIEQQLRLLGPYPPFQMAVALMIHAGLRKSEALWLARENISEDLSHLSIVNKTDPDTNTSSALKTGERAVTILPPLKALLESYLPTLQSSWIVHKDDGGRWHKDAFWNRLKEYNQMEDLRWVCNEYRHTYATQRANEGWPLFRIAKEMGNSVVITEKHYAAYIRPS
jgi:integrase